MRSVVCASCREFTRSGDSANSRSTDAADSSTPSQRSCRGLLRHRDRSGWPGCALAGAERHCNGGFFKLLGWARLERLRTIRISTILQPCADSDCKQCAHQTAQSSCSASPIPLRLTLPMGSCATLRNTLDACEQPACYPKSYHS